MCSAKQIIGELNFFSMKGKVNTVKTIERFYNELIASEELKEKLAAVSGEQKLDEFLKENEVEGTKE